MSFCGFAIRRIARAAVTRRGGSPFQLSPGLLPLTPFCRSVRCLSPHTLLRSAQVVVFVPKPAGRAPLRTGICKFCEPPQGGASARTAEAGLYFYKPRSPRTSFLSIFPLCRQLTTPVCRGVCERFAVVAVVRLFEPCGPQPPAAEARKRAPQAAPDISLNHCSASSAAFLRAIA